MAATNLQMGNVNYIPRIQTQKEQDLIDEIFREFGQLQTYRSVFAGQWEEVAELILPTSRNTFFYGNYNWPGQKKTEKQIDSNGMVALHRFSAIMDSLLTPRNMYWHGLEADNPYVMKDRDTQLWFDLVTKILFKWRYHPHGNFAGQNFSNYQSLGAFGTGAMFVDAFDDPYGAIKGLRYKAIPLGEIFLKENHQGLVDGFIRWFRLTARQAYQKWGDRIPPQLYAAMQQNSEAPFNFLQRVAHRSDFDPQRLDEKGKPYGSWTISIEGRCLVQEGGYHTFPVAASRYDQTPGEVYGRSPAMMVLPALKTLNAEKRVFLKQGHRATDPVLLTADDGIVDFTLRPGALNKGGVTSDGKPLVQVLPTGEIQISKEMMAEEKGLIQDMFLVALFQILQETPQMSATEVIERTNEKGILLAPTVGRQQSEYAGVMIPRELDVLMQQRLIPPMPARLREAGGEYNVVYTSPIARAMKAGEIGGFMRTIEVVKELVGITGDLSLLDPFDFQTAVPEIAQFQSVPPRWMSTDEQMKIKARTRAKQQQIQQQIQAMPAQAAMKKADAKVAETQAKIGGGQGQAPGGVGAPAPGQDQGQPGM